MTTYCRVGDKPKVYITFKDGVKHVFLPLFSPLEVIVENFTNHTFNYVPGGYQLSCYSTNNERGYTLAVRDYEVRDSGSNIQFKYRYQLWVQLCESNDLTLYFNVDPSSIVINNNITCSTIETNEQKSKVHIKPEGSTVDSFVLVGDSPGKIEVACGDCPPGYCRCVIPEYPGYCCLDCNATAEQIKVITNELRSKNDGHLR